MNAMKDDESAKHNEETVVRLGFEDKAANENDELVEPTFSFDKDPFVIEMDLPYQGENFGNDITRLDETSADLPSFIDFQPENDIYDNN